MTPQNTKHYDAVIMGAGPAGEGADEVNRRRIGVH